MNLIDITRNSYFKSISNVEQQVFLFEDTLRNNITLYKEFSEEELNDVIKKSRIGRLYQRIASRIGYYDI